MSDWIEDAELGRNPDGEREQYQESIEQKKQAVQVNVDKIGRQFDEFTAKVAMLALRVNKLPEGHRPPIGDISCSSKKSHLNNHLFVCTSGRRIVEKEDGGLFGLFSSVTRYKQVRVVFLSISRKEGYVDIEYKDYLLRKRRLSSAYGDGEGKQTNVHELFHIPIERLNDQAVRSVIDWLAHKGNEDTLPLT